MPRKKENPIRRTVGKGGNYRKTKSGAGMTKKAWLHTGARTPVLS